MAGKPRIVYAYCFASGHIAFGPKVPTGGLAICKGPPARVRDLIEATARHGWGAERPLLVPGIPEAQGDQDAGLDALLAFTTWLAKTETPGVEIIHSQHSDGAKATANTIERQKALLESGGAS